jgi:hypothetical protein
VTAQSATQAEDILPDNAIVVAELELKGKIKQPVIEFLENIVPHNKRDIYEKPTKFMENEILLPAIEQGKRIILALYLPDNQTDDEIGVLVVPRNEDYLSTLNASYTTRQSTSSKNNHPYTIIGSEEDFVMAEVGDMVVFTDYSDNMDWLLDNTNSALSKNTYYQSFKEKAGASIGSVFMNIAQLSVAEELGQEIFNSTLEMAYEGITLSEFAGGYTMQIIAETRDGSEMKFNVGESFVPKLYKLFPFKTPYFYSEGFNLRATWDQAFTLNTNSETTNIPFYNSEVLEGVTWGSSIKLFSQEYALALQQGSNNQLFPAITIMTNSEGYEEVANDIINKLNAYIEEFLTDLLSLTQQNIKVGGTPGHAYSFKLNNANPDLDETELTFSFGLTADSIFYFSTADLESHFGEGIGELPGFREAFSDRNSPTNGILYTDVRGIWNMLDELWNKLVDKGYGITLNALEAYYQTEKQFYSIRSIFQRTKATANEMSAWITINTDNTAAPSNRYEKVIEKLQKDTDGDGIDDYDELFIHYTDAHNSDTDLDGVDDFEEIQAGTNPYAYSSNFKDLPENTWYHRQVNELSKQGAISGYLNENDFTLTFEPGNSITRCEFLAMLHRSYDNHTPFYVNERDIPFNDMSTDNWCTKYAVAAYRKNIVQGNPDGSFRGNKTITRAEAAQLIRKTSSRLQDIEPTKKPLPFTDVDENQWYYDAITDVYAGEVMFGKETTRFEPTESLKRAEAAVLIKRALDQDVASRTTLKPTRDMLNPLVSPTIKKYLPGI